MKARRRAPAAVLSALLVLPLALIGVTPAAAATIPVDNWRDLATAFSGVGVDDVIVLEDNIDSPPLTGLLMNSTSTLVLDLNGYTLNVTAGFGRAGVGVPPGATLTIQDSSVGGDGTLSAQGGEDGAGIGGASFRRSFSDGGLTTITGGTVTAFGGTGAAGIGGGLYGFADTTIISGGTVTAAGRVIVNTFDNNAAGIGSGLCNGLGCDEERVIGVLQILGEPEVGAATTGAGPQGSPITNPQMPACVGYSADITESPGVWWQIDIEFFDICGPPTPSISVVKSVNGDDANVAPGVFIEPGSDVVFTYVVTNTGNTPLSDIDLVDDVEGPVTCPETELAVGAFMTCTVETVAEEGAYVNTGTVTGTPPPVQTPNGPVDSPKVTDDDVAHYFGPGPAITVVKSVNGADANTAPGVNIATGSPVTFTYVVTNTGDVPLTGISLDDDIEGAITCPETELAAGAFMTCTLTGEVAAEGQYTNVGTVTGTPPQTQTPTGLEDVPDVTDDDPANYFGATPEISIVKSVNGVDANTAPGVFITPGSAVVFTYLVTNTGNVPLTGISLDDDIEGAISCPETELAVDASMTCTLDGMVAEVGQYTNVGTVTGTPPPTQTPTGLEVVPDVTDDDPANYFGPGPGISVVKSVNGADANEAPGVYIEPGSAVVFTYVVTNIGDVDLTNVRVVDDIEGDVTCPETALAVGESMTCTVETVAVEGAYVNEGTASGTPPTTQTPDGPERVPDVTDDDPANYVGAVPGITVLKTVNGKDAPTAPGPAILPGSPVIFTYLVTNTGNTQLFDIDLVDDIEGAVTCPETELAAGASMTCTLETVAIVGEYVNVGLVSALSPLMQTPSGPEEMPRLTADDPAHYVGDESFLAWTGANPMPVGIAALALMLLGGMLLVLRARRAGGGAHIVNVRT